MTDEQVDEAVESLLDSEIIAGKLFKCRVLGQPMLSVDNLSLNCYRSLQS